MNRIALTLLAGVATLGFVSSSHAADLIIESPVSPGIVDVSGNWDGVYIGVFGGYAAGSLYEDLSNDLSGWLVGATVGANFTLTNGIVAGVVGDIAWSDIAVDGIDAQLDWVGSIRGRLGFDGGAFMPYVTAGVAFASHTFNPAPFTETHVGWTAGAGVEFAATEDLSIDLQYRYTDYGVASFPGPDVGVTTHQVTAGLNWHF